MVEIMNGVPLAEEELRFEVSRSGGPGGQNVNKVATRVALCFDVPSSASLTSEQKVRVLSKLSSRLTGAGVLRVISQRHRTQTANRRAALERFAELLAGALVQAPPRHRTRTPFSARARRLDAKKRRGALKSERSSPRLGED